tara:strand:- start:141 stop:1400 length:1260 start_codon:yes stop_codon:yes gene_type:complete
MSFLNIHNEKKNINVKSLSFKGKLKAVGVDIIKTPSFNVSGFTSLNISFLSPGITTLKIYTSNNEFQTFNNGATDNFATDYSLLREERITGSNHFYKTIPIRSKFLLIRINYIGAVGDLLHLDTRASNIIQYQGLSLLDEEIKKEDNASLSRGANYFDLDVADGGFEGYEKIQMEFKGGLTSNDSLLWSNSLNTLSYLSPSNDEFYLNVSSTSPNDNNGNFGAKTIKIYGIGTTGLERTEDLHLNGTSTVSTALQYKAINKIEVSDLGQNSGVGLDHNVGDIILKPVIGGVEQFAEGLIAEGDGVSYNPFYSVPYNKILYITKISINSFCEDEGELTFNKHIYNSNKWIKHKLKKVHLHSQQQLSFDCMFAIKGNTSSSSNNGSERFTVSRKATAVPIGLNEVNVSIYGFLKDAIFTPN